MLQKRKLYECENLLNNVVEMWGSQQLDKSKINECQKLTNKVKVFYLVTFRESEK